MKLFNGKVSSSVTFDQSWLQNCKTFKCPFSQFRANEEFPKKPPSIMFYEGGWKSPKEIVLKKENSWEEVLMIKSSGKGPKEVLKKYDKSTI